MQHLYFASTFASALTFLLLSLLLFFRRKEGGRARIILVYIGLFSVLNYLTRFIALCHGETPESVVSVRMLLLAIFMIITTSVYPIEVIFPGWLNFKRLLMIYSPFFFLVSMSLISVWAGVKYQDYYSLWDMFPYVEQFNVWFRLLLFLFIFLPVLLVFFMLFKKQWNNNNLKWLKKYALIFTIANLAYILVLIFENSIIHTLYYYVSIGTKLFVIYMELFVRPIGTTEEEVALGSTKDFLMDWPIIHYANLSMSPKKSNTKQNNIDLIDRLNTYMKEHCAWRDPDLSLQILSSKLCTNRTSLTNAMRDKGYGNYTYYINRLRIEDFLQQVKQAQSPNFQDIFFEVGFRSRSAALRNFKLYTGMTPSEYFDENI